MLSSLKHDISSILLVDNLTREMEYSDKTIDSTKFPKIKKSGQIKLLLSEMNFLTNYVKLDNFKNTKLTILYIGSGEGYHIPYLIEIYKDFNIDWFFFDPVGHCSSLTMKSGENIIINNRYFTNIDIETFKKHNNLIFISDIRTVDKDCLEPTTKNLLNDFKLQNNILEKLEPMFSLVKFRMPFPDDWDEDYKFMMPVGVKYLQPFSGPNSAEFRIALNKIIQFKEISDIETLKEYERKFAWYNKNRFENNYKIDYSMAAYIFNSVFNTDFYSIKNILDFLKKISNNF